DVALARLQREGGGVVGLKVCDAGESIGAGAISEIIQSATTDVGDVDAKAQFLFAAGISGKVSAIEVVLGAPGICLSATFSKGSRHSNLRVWGHARNWGIEVAHQESQLIQPV